MDNIQELKKLKELLDDGILTQEEFNVKKKKLLEEVSKSITEQETEKTNTINKNPNKAINKNIIKTVGIIACIIILIVIAITGIKNIVNHNQQIDRAAALETGIKSIMNEYDINNYTVKYNDDDSDFNIYAEGFESLSNYNALNCLKELDGVAVDDPHSTKKLTLHMTKVHPGIEIEYSYWRISSYTASLNNKYDGPYKFPGIYTNRNGISECVYECDN